VHGEHAAAQAPRLGTRGNAIADGAAPALAIDDDAARACAHVARLLEQGADGRGRARAAPSFVTRGVSSPWR
jgi:hypothetical protein